MPKILAFSSCLVTLEFQFITFLKLECMLLKIFDAEFPYILSYFEPLCLPAEIAAKTVKRPIETDQTYRAEANCFLFDLAELKVAVH